MTCSLSLSSFFFFFNDTATTEIYTLSLHDALPILTRAPARTVPNDPELNPIHSPCKCARCGFTTRERARSRSEEHTSELQSRQYLVCRLLLEKKKNIIKTRPRLVDLMIVY